MDAEAVAYSLGFLVREASSHVRLGVRARHGVDGFLFVLQGLDDLAEKFGAVVEEGRDHVFAGRTNGEAIGGFVVRAEREALPHVGALGGSYLPVVVTPIFAISKVADQSVKPPMNSR